MTNVNDILRQIKTAIGGIWERRWIGLSVAWVIGGIAAVGVYKFPERYEATARVHIDSQTILRPLLQGLTVQQDAAQQATMLARTLISRPNIENLLKEADGDRDSSNTVDHARLVDSLITRIKLVSAGRDNLFSVAFRDPDPGYALRIVEGLVTTFLSASQGNKRKDADAAQRFIGEQIAIYEKRLDEAENRLKDFKLKNLALLGTDGRDYFARIAEVERNVDRIRIELRAQLQSRDAMRRNLTRETLSAPTGEGLATQEGTPAALVSEFDGRLEAARRQLDELMTRFTDAHPDVRHTKELVQHLTVQRQKDLEQRRRTAEGRSGAGSLAAKKGPQAPPNLVVSQIKIALADAEGKIASLQSTAAEYEAQLQHLRSLAQRIPQIDAEFTQLNRDYDIQKKNYESLVSRREQAAMSGEMGAVGGLTSFRVVDPPRVAPTPVFPSRLHLLPIALVAVFAVGLACSFAASQLAPTFRDAEDLRDVLERPVLGTVSFLATDRMVRSMRRRHAAFAMGVIALVCGYGAMFVMLSVSSGVI
jgi:polysaccharide chain length determinant protein (PEP-CTERM system associated)